MGNLLGGLCGLCWAGARRRRKKCAMTMTKLGWAGGRMRPQLNTEQLHVASAAPHNRRVLGFVGKGYVPRSHTCSLRQAQSTEPRLDPPACKGVLVGGVVVVSSIGTSLAWMASCFFCFFFPDQTQLRERTTMSRNETAPDGQRLARALLFMLAPRRKSTM